MEAKLVCLFIFIVQVQLCPFLPHHVSPPHPSVPPTLEPTPFGFVHMSYIHVPWWPFPYCPLLSFSPLISGYCQFILYFNISSCILIACFFCWLGSLYRWGHVVFVFHCLACFTWHNALWFHPCCHKGVLSSFLLNRIPLSKCTTFFWSTHLLMGTEVASSTWLL